MHHVHADQAGFTTPENRETGHRANGAGLMDQSTPLDSAAPVARAQAIKRLERVAAALALKGRELYPLPCGAFLIVHVDRCRRAADLCAVEDFAADIGAPR